MDRGLELFIQYQGLVAAWASALATTAAALVALWLGTADQRDRRARSKLSDDMLQHMLSSELFRIKNVAESAPAFLDHLCQDYWGKDKGKANREYLRWLGNRFQMPLARGHFEQIANMRESDAKLLAALLGEVPRLHDTLNEVADRYETFENAFGKVAEGAKERMRDIRDAIDLLDWV